MDDERSRSTVIAEEIKKWDDFYRNAPANLETSGVKEFGVDFAGQVEAFLPSGSRVLEAGCGAGLQSLALARTKKYHVSLMDFSSEALKYARGLFEREKLEADFLQGNVIEKGEARYDLVFNAGSLEHYTFQEQVNYLEGMASRSKRYVLALVPNPYCYWYWIWRIKSASEGAWPFGKEAPPPDLSKAFERAGLTGLAELFLGENWAGGFIDILFQAYPALRGIIHQAHRSPVIPKAQKSYFLAFLGSTSPQDRESLSSFKARPGTDLNPSLPEAISSISDALSLSISESHKNKMLTEELTRLRSDLSALDVKWKQAEAASQAHHQHAQEAGRAFEVVTAELGQVKASVAEREKQLLEKTASEMDSLKARLTDAQASLERVESKAGESQSQLVEAEKQLAETQVQLQSVLDDKTSTEQQLSQHQKQLNNITTSDFWKLATRYYFFRDNFPPARYAHRTLRSLKKRYQAMRRRGEPPAQPENQIAPAPSPDPPVPSPEMSAEDNPHLGIQWLKKIDVTVLDEAFDPAEVKTGFSLVTTIKNEAEHLGEFLKSIQQQTLAPAEIIVVDGGSTDSSVPLLRRFATRSGLPIRIIEGKNLNIAQGRNEGIAAASQERIVLCDAGCVLDPGFCANLVGAFHDATDMVGGIYHYLVESPNAEKDISDFWDSLDWNEFLPSARSVAVRKSLCQKCGGFPEHLTLTGEDTLFDVNYRRVSSHWTFNKKAFVHWRAPAREDSFNRLLTSYGRGDGESGIGDRRFYHVMNAKNSLNEAQEDPNYFQGYLLGREQRPPIEFERRHLRGLALTLSGIPFCDSGGNQRGTQLDLELIKNGIKVIHVNVFPNQAKNQPVFFDVDLSLLELYHLQGFDLHDFMARYQPYLDRMMVVLEHPHPLFVPVFEEIKRVHPGIKVIYDCIADWSSCRDCDWYSADTENGIIRSADYLVAADPALVEAIRTRSRKPVHLFPDWHGGTVKLLELVHLAAI